MADMASELEAIAFRLRRAGSEDLAREITAAMRDGVQPVPDAIRDGLKPKLPDRYAAALEEDLDIKVTARNAGGDAVLSVTATTRSAGRRRIRRLDRGVLEHPLWGNRRHWYGQQVGPGWFTGPCEDRRGPVRAGLEQALRDVAAKAEGR